MPESAATADVHELLFIHYKEDLPWALYCETFLGIWASWPDQPTLGHLANRGEKMGCIQGCIPPPRYGLYGLVAPIHGGALREAATC